MGKKNKEINQTKKSEFDCHERNFWMKLLAAGDSDTVSVKRLSIILSLVVLIILAFMSAFGHACAPEFIYIFGSLVAAQSGLTTIEHHQFEMGKLKQNATDNAAITTTITEEIKKEC